MQYLGDYKEDETVYFLWSTNDVGGASVTRTIDGTVSVYKDNGVTQSVAGITDTEDFDSLTGIHACTIDLSADAFYATGADYAVVLSGATIDGQTVNAVLAHFSIENRFQEVDVVKWLGTAPLALSSQRVQTHVASMANDVVSAAAFAQAAADKAWSTVTRALTDKAGFTISGTKQTLDALNDITAAAVWEAGTRTLTSFGTLAQDIWDKATSALTTAGSIGKLLVDNVNATISSRSSHGDPTSAIKGSPGKTNQEVYDNERGTDGGYTGTPPTKELIADQVWDEATVDHESAGSFGKLVGQGIAYLKQKEQGKWEIKNNQLIFYDTDGVTPIRTFNLFDENGNPTNTNPFKREPV